MQCVFIVYWIQLSVTNTMVHARTLYQIIYFIVAAISKYFCVFFLLKVFSNSFSWKLGNRFYLYLYMNLFLAGISNIYKEAERRLIQKSTLDSKYCDIWYTGHPLIWSGLYQLPIRQQYCNFMAVLESSVQAARKLSRSYRPKRSVVTVSSATYTRCGC